METLANPWVSLAAMAVLFLAAVMCALLKSWKGECDKERAVAGKLQSKLQEKTEANGRLHLKYLAAQERVELLEKEPKAPQLGRLGELVRLIDEWGEARSIPEHSTAYAQSLKTQEELDELKKALVEEDGAEAKDAIGDIFVTLVMVCACQRWCLLTCVELAYAEIKNRTGHLNKDGVFVKDDYDT